MELQFPAFCDKIRYHTGQGASDVDHETPMADQNVLPTLLRYRDQHRWSWNLSMRLINLYYGTNYTEKQLKALYKKH